MSITPEKNARMNELIRRRVADAAYEAIRKAELELPDDYLAALKNARSVESRDVAKREYENIFENISDAKRLRVPICQDTGMHIFYVTVPEGFPMTCAISEGIRDGVIRATKEIPLRPNAVDPLTRKNSGDNSGAGAPAVHISIGDKFTVTAMPKGGGSENMSRMYMLLPSQTGDIKKIVAETVLEAGGRPCPPLVLGIGIGGTFDSAPALAKEALLLPLDSMDDFEREICDCVNKLGIGPMGLGGDTTCIAVKVKKAHCHTASLPLAVNIQCWVNRHATVEVDTEGMFQ